MDFQPIISIGVENAQPFGDPEAKAKGFNYLAGKEIEPSTLLVAQSLGEARGLHGRSYWLR